MADFTFDHALPYPDGALVAVYEDRGQLRDGPIVGDPVATATVGAGGSLTILDLTDRTGYLAVGFDYDGQARWLGFSTRDTDVDVSEGGGTIVVEDGSTTAYGAKFMADAFLGVSPSANRWLGLYVSGTEISTSGGTNYARQQCAFDPVTLGLSMTDLVDEELWPAAGVDWGLVSAIGIFDAATAGNELAREGLLDPVYIQAGGRFQMPADALDVLVT